MLGLCNQLIELQDTKHAIKHDANEQPVLFAIRQRILANCNVLEMIDLDAVRDAGTAQRHIKIPMPYCNNTYHLRLRGLKNNAGAEAKGGRRSGVA